MADRSAPELDPVRGPNQVAGFLLEDEGDAGGFWVPNERWPEVLATLRGERLTGLALAAAEHGWLRLTDDQVEGLVEGHRKAMGWSLMIERTLLRMAAGLEERGVGFLVLKGPSLAHTVYPDPSWRPFGDLDLLVRTADWRTACSVLAELGFRRRLPEPRPGFDERFGKAATHVGEGGLEIDLHRTLVLGPFGLWLTPGELFERTASFDLGGRTFSRLDDTTMLVHMCLHASLGFQTPLTLPLRDVAQVSRAGAVDWEAFGDVVDRWRVAAVVQHAFRAVSQALRVSWPSGAGEVMNRAPGRREQRALLAYTTSRRKRGGMALTTLWAIPGVRAKAAFVGSLLFPQRSFLSARYRKGPRTYRRRWMVSARWFPNGRHQS